MADETRARRAFTGARDPEVEALFARTLPQMAADIRARALPRLVGVWLGGGYGRGEGGVCRAADGAARPYNDVDLFVFTDGASAREKAACARALAEVAARYAPVFGVDVDFCRPRNPADYKKDEGRLMIQELKRGHVALLGGEGLLDHVAALPAHALPRGEAARLLMNRGMGLVLAARARGGLGTRAGADFFLRNVNKAVLGAGDARLIAGGRYAWTLAARVARLGEPAYAAAAAFKLRPSSALPADPDAAWRRAREAWMRSLEAVGLEGTRTLREAARWLVRRRTLGPARTLGEDCTARVLRQVRDALARDIDAVACAPSLERDWRVFN